MGRMPADVPDQFDVCMQPSGRRFPAHFGQTLVEAAAAAGIELETSCRNGTCRACIVQLAQGSVAYRIEWPGLLPEEKREGWILPCVALPRSDLVLEMPAL
jgi:ferredoxin